MAPLTGRQKKLLMTALSAAFPSYDELDMLLALELDRSLADISAPAGLEMVAYRLVNRAVAHNWVSELVTAAALRNPGNEELRSLIAGGQLDLPRTVGRLLDEPAGEARELLAQGAVLDGIGRPQLQQIVNAAVGFQDAVAWATALTRLAAQVCRVEVVTSGSTARGTGFLVGPDLVLTNQHVLARVLHRQVSPAGVRFRFDFHIRGDGTVCHGVDVGLAPEWALASSPPSSVDVQDAPQELPGSDELDYALVRLDGRPGEDGTPWGDRRGWVDVLAAPPRLRAGTPLLILQHPAGQPVKLAIDTGGVLEINGNATRLTYGVNTERGSSGSPCFTVNLAPVAVHHAGGAEYGAGRNEGIPIAAIVDHLRAAGLHVLLEG